MPATVVRRAALIGIGVAGLTALGLSVSWILPVAGSEIFTDLVRGVGAGGYDVVAYFSAGRPVAGSAQITHPWNGAVWRFSNMANRDAFAAAPERYAPAYGGHCSWAAAQGYKAKGDPNNWKIVGGRLFLNYNADVQKTWETNIPGFIASADSNWPGLRQK
ncbi:MAG: YHS domain-containing (seleno)protein [Bosea sp. (in: a-proteobacteria)]